MYEEIFNFTSRPFTSAPFVKHYFASESMHQALVQARQSIDRAAGPVVVVGDSGSGKSLLLAMLESQYQRQFNVSNLGCVRLDTREALLQSILFTLGQPHQGMGEGDLRFALIDYLKPSDRCPNGVLLLIDDAHELDVGLLDEVKLITNYVRDGQPRVRLVLAGSQRLEDKLAEPSLQSLNQRISSRCFLTKMRRSETIDYVREHLLRVGGYPDEIFNEPAMKAIHECSDGVPRLVNQICEHSFMVAGTEKVNAISEKMVREAWNDVQGIPGTWADPEERKAELETLQSDESWTVIEFGSLDEDDVPGADSEASFEESEPEAQPVAQEHVEEQALESSQEFEEESAVVEFDFGSPDTPISEENEERLASQLVAETQIAAEATELAGEVGDFADATALGMLAGGAGALAAFGFSEQENEGGETEQDDDLSSSETPVSEQLPLKEPHHEEPHHEEPHSEASHEEYHHNEPQAQSANEESQIWDQSNSAVHETEEEQSESTPVAEVHNQSEEFNSGETEDHEPEDHEPVAEAQQDGPKLGEPVPTVDPFAEDFEEVETIKDPYAPVVAEQNFKSLSVTSEDLEALRPLADPGVTDLSVATYAVGAEAKGQAACETSEVSDQSCELESSREQNLTAQNQEDGSQLESQMSSETATENRDSEVTSKAGSIPTLESQTPVPTPKEIEQQIESPVGLQRVSRVIGSIPITFKQRAPAVAEAQQNFAAPEPMPASMSLQSKPMTSSEPEVQARDMVGEGVEQEAEAILARLRMSQEVSHETDVQEVVKPGLEQKNNALQASQNALAEILEQKNALASSQAGAVETAAEVPESPENVERESVKIEYPLGGQSDGQLSTDDREMIIVSRTEQQAESARTKEEPANPPFPETPVSTGRAERMDYQQLFDQLRDISSD